MDSWEGLPRLVVVAFLVSVALGGGAVAQVDEPVWAPETAAALERIVDGHNAAVDGVDLGPAGNLARDQRVTLTVTDTDGSVARFSFRTDAAAHVVDFRAGPRDDATVRMFTDPATVDRIADAPDRTAAFEAAVRAGDVRIEGVGLLNRTAWALVGLVLWALASPLQAAAVGAVVLLGAGALAVAGTKVVGGGAVVAGSVGATGTSGTGVGATGVSGAGASGSTGATTGSSSTGVSASGTSSGASATGPSGGGVTESASDALAATGANTMTAGSSVNPVGVADRVLSVFERALFIVAIVKKLGRRVRRGLGSTVARVLGRFGFVRAVDEDEKPTGDAVVEPPERPPIRRRGVARRRRR
ncbi:hypothetical protein C2R22_14505 [Salinigranum rubrum]|uniref:Uncharacterized protein n=1 Tax=Salinigranum rubrum TaxID=755307 RepID=A0A2I8VLD5_9EURY|nr:hypothetical protein [Salinigranum rubrum]AUV82705.1 hypothetical protein C2R22_14505 [Salinigranum rubrum]